MDEIKKLREEINAIDKQISELLSTRFSVVTKIGEQKKAQGILVCDQTREQEVIKAVCANLSGKQREYVQEIYREIIKNSRKIQE